MVRPKSSPRLGERRVVTGVTRLGRRGTFARVNNFWSGPFAAAALTASQL